MPLPPMQPFLQQQEARVSTGSGFAATATRPHDGGAHSILQIKVDGNFGVEHDFLITFQRCRGRGKIIMSGFISGTFITFVKTLVKYELLEYSQFQIGGRKFWNDELFE